MTPNLDLHVRQDACQQASQSASEAIRQATQQASQSVQQASQQASQASREASQSATEAIRQAQQTASQSMAQASRSASSVSSSANSVVSRIQASADSAVFRANLAMQTAQLSASVAQSEASRAVVAAQQIGPTAASQLTPTSPVATSSQGLAISSAQLALAIVGSIIASSLLTIIALLIILRHKKLSAAARAESLADGSNSVDDLKLPVSGVVTTTIETSKPLYSPGKDAPPPSPHVMFSLFPAFSSKNKTSENQNATVVDTTMPKTSAPKSPSLRTWLRGQDNVSPFGPLQLPTTGSKGPLGGQLKSPLRGPPPRFVLDVSANKDLAAAALSSVPGSTSKHDSANPQPSSPKMTGGYTDPSTSQAYRESKASVWTDALTDDGTAMATARMAESASGTQKDTMGIPPPRKPIRNTAEWLMDHATFRAFSPDMNSRNSRQSLESRGSFRPGYAGGLPNNPRGSNLPFRQRPGSNQKGGGVQGSNGLLDPKDISRLSKDGAKPNTPGVGKAI